MNAATHVELGKASAKFGLLASLYFSQGLPFGFFTQALPVLLRQAGSSLREIGFTSLLALPWALKFLWAPLVDRSGGSSLGRRKTWIVPLQLGAVAILLALALGSTQTPLGVVLVAVFLLNLLAATQDIATDGLAVDLLAPSERGLANGLQVAAYRVGMIVGGGVLLVSFEELGPSLTYALLALMTALATWPVLVSREPPRASGGAASVGPRRHFLRRPGALRVLVLLVTYKFGDAFATGMLRPFLSDAGLTLADIGWLLGTVGFVAGLLGALAGGGLVNRLGRKPSLLLFGLFQAISVAGYAALTVGTPKLSTLYALCAAEHFAGGMATAALFTCMMDWCSPHAGATDYTVQASAVVIATGLASTAAGFSAEALGYTGHFWLAAALALAALLVAAWLFPSNDAAHRLRASASEEPSCV